MITSSRKRFPLDCNGFDTSGDAQEQVLKAKYLEIDGNSVDFVRIEAQRFLWILSCG